MITFEKRPDHSNTKPANKSEKRIAQYPFFKVKGSSGRIMILLPLPKIMEENGAVRQLKLNGDEPSGIVVLLQL
jgi:hypothetical protein